MLKHLIIGLALLVMTVTGAAQPSWSAWLYTATDGTVTRISASGEIIDAFRLPLSQAFNAYGEAVVASPTGRFVAYIAEDTTSGFANRQLVVYDTRADFIRFTYDLTDVELLDFELHARPTAFDEAAQTFAFGMVRAGAWELALADLSLESLKGMGPLTEAAAALDESGVPTVLWVLGEEVTFGLFPADGTGRPLTLYTWRPDTGPQPAFNASTEVDVLAQTGELVTAVDNTVSILTGASDGEVYTADGLDVRGVWWVGGGEQLLLRASDPATSDLLWVVIDRAGAVIGQFQLDIGPLMGAPDGVAGLFSENGGVSLVHLETLGATFEARTVYTTTDPDTRLILVVGG